jgi:hypothetical protein
MSVFESLTTLSPGIGFLIGGAVAAAVSPRVAFVVASVGTLAVVAGVMAVRPWRGARRERVLM